MHSDAAATFEDQYQALRFGCGAVELVNWSSVSVTGRDRQPFLHNFCTNDIKRLEPGQSCEAFFTNAKGKIVGHGLVSCRANEHVIFGVPGQSQTLIEHLERYVIREDVRFQDATEARRYVLVAGGKEARGMESGAVQPIGWNLVGSAFAVVWEVPAGELQALLASMGERGVLLAGGAFNAARIEAKIPLFTVDFDQDNFPQEVGRDREAISFTKGCYLGQETVARIDALGHVNQQVGGVRFPEESEVYSGMELSRDDHGVGHVTSFAYSPQLRAKLALAMVRRAAIAPGNRLDSPAGEGEVIALPLQIAPS